MKKTCRTLKTSAALACAIAIWFGMPSYNVVDAASNLDNLIVVKATRAEEKAKHEPQKVSIITKKEIESKQAKTVEEVIFTQTGVSKSVDSMGRTGVSIRGAEPRHTLILVDGQQVMGEFAKYMGASDEVSRIGTENVDHIEVIQGAASSKYGADAIGGVVNIITKKAKKKPALQFNVEGRQTAHSIKGMKDSPYNNFFLRADSGKIGKAAFSVYGSKRDVMPVVAHNERRKTAKLFAMDVSEFPKNSLRYYGNTSNVGLMGTYDINKNHKIEARVDHFNEDLHRFVKHSNSDMEPMVQFKRRADRDTYNLAYVGREGKTDWRIEGNYTHLTEDDISIRSQYATNVYEGKNTLNSVDDIDHKQLSFKSTVNHALNDKHLLSIGMGYSKEDGEGSRLKSAPDKYQRKIDPWDYDKALYVKPIISTDAEEVPDTEKPVSSMVHDYKISYDEQNRPYWNFEYEAVNYDASKPESAGNIKPPVGVNEYINNKDAFDKGWNSPLNADEKARKDEFNRLLYEENKEKIDKMTYYNKDYLIRDFFDRNSVMNLTFNGKTFLQNYRERENTITMGKATIKKHYLTVQDTWNVNENTIVVPIIRYDHSDKFGSNISASAGITHNLSGDPRTRLKANIGTGYSEPGMGELYYNWEMYGGNPTGFGEARLGWYWVGNPNLKPEKSVNMDFGFEKEMNRTSIKASVFHNDIKDYLSVYFTGELFDTHPWLDSSSAQGFWKFMYAPDMIYSFKNIGKVEINGADFEIKQRMGKHWETRLGYTYLNARNKTDASMPTHLLDKPVHKVDIGLNYQDKKRGWSGSLYGNYYIDMLDSNSLESKGSYMETDGWGAPHPSITYFFKDKEKHEYEKKTFGIWNLMIQKKLNDSATAYLGINNLFNHHDDDRATQEKVYRVGMNFKVSDVFDTKAAIDPETGEVKIAKMDKFIEKPFVVNRDLGVNWVGDIRVRNSEFTGENRPSAGVRPGSFVEKNAQKTLQDKSGSALETRMRIGVDARIADKTNFELLGSLSSSTPLDSSTPTGENGPKHGKIEKADITQNAGKWDFSIGRLSEDFGVTKYWFDKQFDGGRMTYTDDKLQISAGVGSFKHSTGINDSAYTHATYKEFIRPPYLSEFLGIARSGMGFFSGGLLPDDQMPKGEGSENVAFVKQLADIMSKYRKDHPDMEIVGGFGDKPLVPEDYPVMELVGVLRHMQTEVLKAYEGNSRLFNSGPKERNFGSISAIKGRSINIPSNKLDIIIKTKDGERHFGDFSQISKLPSVDQDKAVNLWEVSFDSWKDDDMKFLEEHKLSSLAIDLGDTTLFEGETKDDLLDAWWNKNGNGWINDMETALRYKRNDDSITIKTDPEVIKEQLAKSIFLSPDNSRLMGITESDEWNMPNILVSYVQELAKALELVDNEAIIPREALASTGYGVKMKGTVIENDQIPAIEKAIFVKGKYMLNDKVGLTAWHLRSFDDDKYTILNAHDAGNDISTYKKYANVFAIGAQVKLNDYSAVSLDAGLNATDFAKHMNGNTIYDHPVGTNEFFIKGHKAGSNPKFWTVRVDVGATDTDVPGSWEAFADYKHFEHGAFFGGNGTESLPDRYLDGIKSFTFGAGYVPARDWLVQAFYTFGAEGINKRDTLFGGENFKLGNYTRVQLTYKF